MTDTLYDQKHFWVQWDADHPLNLRRGTYQVRTGPRQSDVYRKYIFEDTTNAVPMQPCEIRVFIDRPEPVLFGRKKADS